MRTENDIQNIINKLNITSEAREYLNSTRAEIAINPIGIGGGNNSISFRMSRKMQHTTSNESMKGERVAAIIFDSMKHIIEFWDHPKTISISITNKKGNKQRVPYTPDFLIFTKYKIYVIQIKLSSNIQNLVQAKPEDWILNNKNQPVHLPASLAFEKYGLSHLVIPVTNKHEILAKNLDTIFFNRDHKKEFINLKKVNKVFNECFYYSLSDLKARLNLNSYSGIIDLIDKRVLFASLRNELFGEPNNCYVTTSKILLPLIDNFITNRGLVYKNNITHIDIIPDQNCINRTIERIKKLNSGIKNSSTRRYSRLIKEGKAKGLTPFQSLIDNLHNSGNRNQLNAVVKEFTLKHIYEFALKNQTRTKRQNYYDYVWKINEAHPMEHPCHENTYITYLNNVPAVKSALLLGGNRLANSVDNPTAPLDRTITAMFAWESASIDHSLLKIYIIYFQDEDVIYVTQPVLTALIDNFTGKILAFSISLDPPSKKSITKTLRQCVEKHQKLPNQIKTDRGSDFKSVYLANLAAHYGVEISHHPKGHSRYGSEIEGFFGRFTDKWLKQRPGNKTKYKISRSFDSKLKPEKLAKITLLDLHNEIEIFLGLANNAPFGTRNESISVRHNQSESDYPMYGVKIKYDQEFVINTCVDIKEYKIDLSRGIQANDIWYSSSYMKNYHGKKSDIEVRIDPENPYAIYVLLNNKWITFYASKIKTFNYQNRNEQLSEGLLKLETSKLMKDIKDNAHIQFAKAVDKTSKNKEADTLTINNTTPPNIPDIDNENLSNDSELYNNIEIRDIKTGEWEK